MLDFLLESFFKLTDFPYLLSGLEILPATINPFEIPNSAGKKLLILL